MDPIETATVGTLATTRPGASAIYDPAPGTEYRYVISDYARAAVRVLGEGWGAESGWYGAFGVIWGPNGEDVVVYVDTDRDFGGLVIAVGSGFERFERPVELPDGAPRDLDDLQAVAGIIANAIRAAV